MPQPKAPKYTRSQRLKFTKTWMKTYKGKRIHHGYAKHFGVNKLCAVIELEMLGIKISVDLKESIICSELEKRIHRKKLKVEKNENLIESDHYFAYIVGYTSGGAPYGITWEEMEEIHKNEQLNSKDICIENEDLPF